jgi:hypothetical protein
MAGDQEVVYGEELCYHGGDDGSCQGCGESAG